ncbi:MAG: TRCF domain-containing protein, partial [Lachnospiraceae bacterium]|nr:TRCF domain-containing protein [Lachnospiraceae bacterium]
LSAIREFTDMGSGFRIAMRDLEIRGAGSILGRAQHGHMSAVGYDLYCKLLGEAVRRAKGEETPPEKTVTVHLNVDAFIPEAYIMNEVQKLETYKKIAAISCKEDFDSVCDELKDRFGDIPASAENLLRIALIRSVASHLDITDITGNAGEITITMDEKARIKVEKIPLLLQRYRGGLRFSAKGGPFFRYTYKPVGLPVRDEEILLNTVEELLISYAALLR